MNFPNVLMFCLFLLKSFWQTHVLLGGHWYPCFLFLVTSPLCFKPEWVPPYLLFCRGKCNVQSLRYTSGATCADLLAAGIAAIEKHKCRNKGELIDLEQKLSNL